MAIPLDIEIKEALFQIRPLKYPGPDGYLAKFFQHMCNSIGPDIIASVQDLLRSRASLKKLIKLLFYISLKKRNPQKVNDFRPVSLSNVIYEIIMKVVANKLKKVVDRIIGSSQRAFVKGRSITDNYIVAHETLHSFIKKK